jgi:hypothetical protein
MRSGNGPGGPGDDGTREQLAGDDAGGEPDLSSKEPVTLIFATQTGLIEHVLNHVLCANSGLIPAHIDPADWEITVRWTVTEYLGRHVDYETWAIIGITPLRMAQLVRMIVAELRRT